MRADNFFGRAALLREILDGERDSLWVVGARRLGKTSLLKELEYRVQQSPQTPFVPLYWDLQGSGDVRGLADGLLGSVEDSEGFRRATDIAVEDLEGMAATDMLTTLVRRTVKSGWRLLLLVDEAEEFLTVARADAAVLPRLRRIFHKGPEVRTVLTSTKRLARIDERTDFATSPFLQGFIPPVYLTPATADPNVATPAFSASMSALVAKSPASLSRRCRVVPKRRRTTATPASATAMATSTSFMQEVSILPRRRWVAVFDCVLGVAMCPQDSERDEVGEAADHSTSAYAKGKPELDRRRITTTIPRRLQVRRN